MERKHTYTMKKCRILLMALIILALPCLAAAETAVASFYPVWLLARELTADIDGITVVNLAPATTGCLHDYQLQTGDMKTLASADAFLVNGAGMESYLPMVTGAFPELPLIDASAGIGLLAAADVSGVSVGDSETEVNAHIWLDAGNAARMVNNLCDGLTAVWPQYADALADGRDAYTAKLEALDAELKEGLADIAHRDIITFHEAFPYFARAYGLNVAAVVNREPGEALSPPRLAELVKVVQGLNGVPLFTEPQYDDLAARTLAAETGCAVWALDPCVTGPEDDTALGYYEQVMRTNLAVLREALQ